MFLRVGVEGGGGGWGEGGGGGGGSDWRWLRFQPQELKIREIFQAPFFSQIL